MHSAVVSVLLAEKGSSAPAQKEPEAAGQVLGIDTSRQKADPKEDAAVLLYKATEARAKGNYDDAEKLLMQALSSDPDNITATVELANITAAQRDYRRSEEYYRKALELSDGSPMIYVGLGNVYLNQRDYQNAQKNFELAIQSDPKFSHAYVGLATLYIQKKDYDRALQAIQKVSGLSNADPMVYLLEGNIYFEQSRITEAVQSYVLLLSQYVNKLPDKNVKLYTGHTWYSLLFKNISVCFISL